MKIERELVAILHLLTLGAGHPECTEIHNGGVGNNERPYRGRNWEYRLALASTKKKHGQQPKAKDKWRYREKKTRRRHSHKAGWDVETRYQRGRKVKDATPTLR
jgi:hypothetical protein